MKKRLVLFLFFMLAAAFLLTGQCIASETIAISGVDISPSRMPVQPGDSVSVTINASSSSNSPVYYKFYYCGNYGSAEYANSDWVTIQEYSTNNTCNYSFPDSGAYVVVVRAVTDPVNEPSALPIVGGVVTVGGGTDTVNISSFASTATPSLKAGESVTLALNAFTTGGNQVSYKFYYCANYGTADYETTVWTAVQEYSSVNYSSYTFPDAGNYIVVARAVTDPSNEPAVLPIFGGLISVNPSSARGSDALAEEILSSSNITRINLNGNSISVEGTGATVSGNKVTITSGRSYYISGTLSDGQIIVDSSDSATVGLVLNGADMNCSSSSPIYVKNSAKTVMVLAENTLNKITDGASYIFEDTSSDEPNAAVFSKDELFICGYGTLNVKGQYNDGIASKDGLTVSGGTINITSVDDGIRGKDFVAVKGGSITVIATGDGFKSDNSEDTTKGFISVESGVINVTAGGDAFDAETTVTVTDGTLNISSGGGSGSVVGSDLSAKGIKGNSGITIGGGNISINSADDAIHSNGTVTVNGGTLSISTGDDAVHADTSIVVNGGSISVPKSYEGIESASITINNGNIHIVASDDGINGAGGNDGSGTIAGPGIMPMPGGARPGQDSFASASTYGLYINGGYVSVDAMGDGIDINGYIEMTNGVVLVNGPTNNGNGPLDYDSYFKMTGGFLVATGSSGMAMAPSTTSTQNSVLVNLSSAKSAGTIIHIRDSAGRGLLTFAPSKTYQSLAFSSPELVNGTYEIYLGGSSTGTLEDSLYTEGVYTPGTRYAGFTVSSIVTSVR